MRNLLIGSVLVVVLCTSSASRADSMPSAGEPRSTSYGGAVFLADLSAIGLGILGAATQNPGWAVAGLATYGLGGPVVHFAHGNIERGFGSLVLRLIVPATAGYVAGLIGVEASKGCQGEVCGLSYGLTGAAIGLGLGVIAASAIDVAVLSHDDAPEDPHHFTVMSDGRSLALAGRF
jgi:hypothetical protein